MYGPNSLIGDKREATTKRTLDAAEKICRRYPAKMIPHEFKPTQVLGFFNAFTYFDYVGIRGYVPEQTEQQTYWIRYDIFEPLFFTHAEYTPHKFPQAKLAPPSIKYAPGIILGPITADDIK